MQAVLRGQRDADVPCDGCVGCCVSSYPIPLRPDDRVALEQIPDRYLQLPVGGGTARMGYREDGSCPMLQASQCTIYADRPRTCRDYDCRIYAATNLLPDGNRPIIQERVREWRFDVEPGEEQRKADSLRRAAQFISSNAALFPPGIRAHSATAIAVLAVKVWPLFVTGTASNEKGDGPEDPSPVEQARRVLEAARAFDSP
jgi:Fe-S-cluster containining protein